MPYRTCCSLASFAVVGIVAGLISMSSGAESHSRQNVPAGWQDALILNEDNSHFFSSRPPEAMTREGLNALIDGYAGSAVTHLFISPNSMRTSFRSQSRDAIWDPVHGVESQARWPQNAKRLFEAGLDPYQVWIERSRQRGISPWLSMRMNDVHSVDQPESHMHSEFWRTHPQLRRTTDGSVTPWVNQALNYVHPEVREHNMSLVKELLERYDPDGLELDWMRFGFHLTPGHAEAEGEILTAFVREVREHTRQWAAQRGHPIFLGVRVPAHPDAARGLGMNAVAWAKTGLIDLIVPTPFWTTSDFDIPLELWYEQIGDATRDVAVIPCLEYNSRAFPAGKSVANDVAMAKGFAASAYARGARNLYLFNWMDSETRPVSAADYTALITGGLTPNALHGQLRRHAATFRDTVPPGFSNGAQLPLEGLSGGTVKLNIGSADALGSAAVIIGLAARDGVNTASLDVKLNGHALRAEAAPVDTAGLGGTARALRFSVPTSHLRSGVNEIQMIQPDASPTQQIVWVELRVIEL